MTIEELYKFLGEFIKKHPKCKDKPIMVKKLGDKTTWEEVTFTSDTGVSSCPEYGSPIYLHSKSQEQARKEHCEEMSKLEDKYDFDV